MRYRLWELRRRRCILWVIRLHRDRAEIVFRGGSRRSGSASKLLQRYVRGGCRIVIRIGGVHRRRSSPRSAPAIASKRLKLTGWQSTSSDPEVPFHPISDATHHRPRPRAFHRRPALSRSCRILWDPAGFPPSPRPSWRDLPYPAPISVCRVSKRTRAYLCFRQTTSRDLFMYQ